MGNGLDEGMQVGPMIDRAALEKTAGLVDDARGHGARGPDRRRPVDPVRQGLLLRADHPPQVDGRMRIMTEEPFAPVMPLLDFSKLDDVIAAANATPYGLAAYVFTNDLTVATRMAEGLEAGIIGINDPVPATPQCPFGGMKESGLGRELGSRGARRLPRNKVRLDRPAGLIRPAEEESMSVATLSSPKLMTAEEFMQIPEDGISRELVLGEVREYGMTLRNHMHGEVVLTLGYLLKLWNRDQPRPRGKVTGGDAGFRLRRDPDVLVGPDVAYVPAELAAGTPRTPTFYDGPPCWR